MIKPDWDDNPKKEEILFAANLLEIGEFQLLQLAYKEWYNEELPERLIHSIFRDYTIRSIIPGWARHYARTIAHLDRTNQLNPLDPKYHVYDREFGKPIGGKGLERFVLVSLSITTFFYLLFISRLLQWMNQLICYHHILKKRIFFQNTTNNCLNL